MSAETYSRAAFSSAETNPLLFGRISRRDYRRAVAQAIFDVKAANSLSNERLGEILGVDEKTIRNAEDESNGCLDPVTMLNLAVFFGEKAIAPIRALYLGSAPAAPRTPAERIEHAIQELRLAEKEITQ